MSADGCLGGTLVHGEWQFGAENQYPGEWRAHTVSPYSRAAAGQERISGSGVPSGTNFSEIELTQWRVLSGVKRSPSKT
jgi:uncharacterized protein with beta-barrel porin domain